MAFPFYNRESIMADPVLDFGGISFYYLFHIESFLTHLFDIGNFTVCGAWPLTPGMNVECFC